MSIMNHPNRHNDKDMRRRSGRGTMRQRTQHMEHRLWVRYGKGVLPYVKKYAVKRVKDTLPVPTECRYCGAAVSLTTHQVVFGGSYGPWPYVYQCDACHARIGLHPETHLPLGTLANKPLRMARSEGKAHFLKVISRFGMSRDDAYRWLSIQMDIPLRECHFAWFDLKQCAHAESVCREALERTASAQHCATRELNRCRQLLTCSAHQ
ncbi:zinc-finger-containing protein [Carnimonas bestiolae]|uniref:zinc-finger-containing protein n=1 Tax=Carnimonas bestiolae TaxID=3402172 RepID=UPI003EDC7AC7